jgi:hypothetical protein
LTVRSATFVTVVIADEPSLTTAYLVAGTVGLMPVRDVLDVDAPVARKVAVNLHTQLTNIARDVHEMLSLAAGICP